MLLHDSMEEDFGDNGGALDTSLILTEEDVQITSGFGHPMVVFSE